MSPSPTRRRLLAGACGLSAGPLGGRALGRAVGARGDGSTPGRPTDPDSLPTVVDRLAERGLDEHGADGATAAVVRSDGALRTAGYGHEFLDPDTPVDPAGSNFRIGSVSKVVTWTAAMRLVDREVVDPDAPVAESLDSNPVPEGEAPVTLAHLATHTPGFVQRAGGNVATDPSDLRPLPAVLADNPPFRVGPPGELPEYTNYAAALAGQAVADAAGTDFASSVEESVFGPLGMARSTAGGAPDALFPGTAAEAADEVDWFSLVPPASGITATADDMARFLRAHLGGGAVDGGRVLSPGAVERMHRRWYTPHEALPGMAFGLPASRRGPNGARVLRHGGATGRFVSDFVLVPERDLGLFVSFHAGSNAAAWRAKRSFVEGFLDRYVPASGGETTPDGPPTRAAELVGTYRPVEVERNPTDAKLPLALFNSPSLDVRRDGNALVTGADDPERWVEVEPLVFRREAGTERLVFLESDGEVTHAVRESAPHTALARVPAYGTTDVQAPVAAAAGTAALSGTVVWPAAAGWRRVARYRSGRTADEDASGSAGPTDPNPDSSPRSDPDSDRNDGHEAGTGGRSEPVAGADEDRTVGDGAVGAGVEPGRARWVAGLVPPLLVAWAVGAAVLVASGGFYERPVWAPIVYALPVLAAGATAAAGVYAARSWREGRWSLAARLHYALVVAGAATLLALLAYWNLLVAPLVGWLA